MSTKNSLVIIIILVLLSGLFFTLKPKTLTNVSNENTISQTKIFEIVIEKGKLLGSNTFTVSEGDEVLMKITSDIADEFHLHGYDRSLELTKDDQNEILFTANITGRFTFEFERAHTELGVLEVLPK